MTPLRTAQAIQALAATDWDSITGKPDVIVEYPRRSSFPSVGNQTASTWRWTRAYPTAGRPPRTPTCYDPDHRRRLF
jgi:hypothetical protein